MPNIYNCARESSLEGSNSEHNAPNIQLWDDTIKGVHSMSGGSVNMSLGTGYREIIFKACLLLENWSPWKKWNVSIIILFDVNCCYKILSLFRARFMERSQVFSCI